MQDKTKELDKEIAETKAALANVHGEQCEVYARIVGYYRSVKNWNKGKKEEYGMRTMFESPAAKADAVTVRCNAAVCPPNKKNEPHYEIFFRKTCPNCPPVKEYMAGVSMQGRSVDVDTDSGLSEAAGKGVFAAPTVIFYDDNGKETARAHTTEELKGIMAQLAA